MRAAGSTPGVAKKIRKESTLIAKSTNTVAIRRCSMKRSTLLGAPQLGPRIERIANAVAEHVQREHGDRDRNSRCERDGRTCVEQLLPVEDDRAPTRVRRLHSDREERERGLG